jgi:hypothetical protein
LTSTTTSTESPTPTPACSAYTTAQTFTGQLNRTGSSNYTLKLADSTVFTVAVSDAFDAATRTAATEYVSVQGQPYDNCTFVANVSSLTYPDGPFYSPRTVTRSLFDWNRDGSARAIRNDLSGALQGMVQFMQMQTSDPYGNDGSRPLLVALRQTLVMFVPVVNCTRVKVKVEVNGMENSRHVMG